LHRLISGNPARRLVVLVAVIFAVPGTRSPAAHETIEMHKVNDLVFASDEASALAKTAVGREREGEALFALGAVLVEATDTLNRDLAAHNGRLTFNAENLLKALAQRDLGLSFDEAIGRYRLPQAPLKKALRLSPEASYALRARFDLLKAGFYESFVLDPFQLVGLSFDELERQITEAEHLAATLPSRDDAEEAAFINAVDLARAARLAPWPEPMSAYNGRARAALAAFAEAYPESMRAAAASVILKGLGAAE
jgi:hypothetical protein